MAGALSAHALGPFGELVEAFRSVFAFGRGRGDRPAAGGRLVRRSSTRGGAPLRKRSGSVKKLVAQGFSEAEVARRTGLSQDAVAMLIAVARAAGEPSPAPGSFAHALQERVSA
jgi:DNA-binding NarL/FixJ family response regulator